MRRMFTIVAALAGVVAGPGVAARTPPAEGIRFGPPIPGLCLLSRADALAGSRAAQAAQARIDRARALVAQQAAGDRARIQAALVGPEGSDPSARAALLQRLDAVRRVEADAEARIAAQSTAAFATIEQDMASALGVVVGRKRCSLIVERSITYGWSNAMDVTPDVIAEMDRAAAAGTQPGRP